MIKYPILFSKKLTIYPNWPFIRSDLVSDDHISGIECTWWTRRQRRSFRGWCCRQRDRRQRLLRCLDLNQSQNHISIAMFPLKSIVHVCWIRSLTCDVECIEVEAHLAYVGVNLAHGRGVRSSRWGRRFKVGAAVVVAFNEAMRLEVVVYNWHKF